MKTLSIIIPCYNEAKTVREIITRTLAVDLGAWQKEVIVVDDCSTDATAAIVEEFSARVRLIRQEKNGGKGTAVRRGLAEALGDYVLIQDADLEYDPEDIPALLAPLQDNKPLVVYGSRNLRPRERRGGRIARLGVWVITKLINLLYHLRLTDVWTCHKLFPIEAKGDFLAGRFESELLFTAALARRGYPFFEVPISYHPREVSEGKKIRYRDGFYAIARIVLDWLKH